MSVADILEQEHSQPAPAWSFLNVAGISVNGTPLTPGSVTGTPNTVAYFGSGGTLQSNASTLNSAGNLSVPGTLSAVGAVTAGNSTTTGSITIDSSSGGGLTHTVPAISSPGYTLTWPAAAPTASGCVLSSTTGGVMSWAQTATVSGTWNSTDIISPVSGTVVYTKIGTTVYVTVNLFAVDTIASPTGVQLAFSGSYPSFVSVPGNSPYIPIFTGIGSGGQYTFFRLQTGIVNYPVIVTKDVLANANWVGNTTYSFNTTSFVWYTS